MMKRYILFCKRLAMVFQRVLPKNKFSGGKPPDPQFFLTTPTCLPSLSCLQPSNTCFPIIQLSHGCSMPTFHDTICTPLLLRLSLMLAVFLFKLFIYNFLGTKTKVKSINESPECALRGIHFGHLHALFFCLGSEKDKLR